jgi:hypothetical protein
MKFRGFLRDQSEEGQRDVSNNVENVKRTYEKQTNKLAHWTEEENEVFRETEWMVYQVIRDVH